MQELIVVDKLVLDDVVFNSLAFAVILWGCHEQDSKKAWDVVEACQAPYRQECTSVNCVR